MALGLQQGVRSAVHHHGRSRHGDNRHTVTDASLQAVVPLVIGHRQQTCMDREDMNKYSERGGKMQGDGGGLVKIGRQVRMD